MRVNLISLLSLFLISGIADLYIFRTVSNRITPRWPRIAAAVTGIIGPLLLLAICLIPVHGSSDRTFATLTWLLLVYFSVYIPKYIFVLFDLISKIPQLFRRRRCSVISIAGVVIAIISFILIWWGTLINRYRIDVTEISVTVDNLPESFDGYRIVQISDLHVGTYLNDTSFVSKVVERINSLNADLVLFTGDIVNRHAEEIIPFIPILQRVHGNDGQMAVLGNHDYSDYYEWSDDAAKIADRRLLRRLYRQTAFDLLTDEHRVIRRGNDSIIIIGVENIGRPPFQSCGSLARAYPDISDPAVKILLSHDPAHWLDSIADNPAANIRLTLSGHTHAMQMKFGRISPAVIAHPQAWAGAYTDTLGRTLYINIGIGTVGAPMRIGATPEITLITLKKK